MDHPLTAGAETPDPPTPEQGDAPLGTDPAPTGDPGPPPTGDPGPPAAEAAPLATDASPPVAEAAPPAAHAAPPAAQAAPPAAARVAPALDPYTEQGLAALLEDQPSFRRDQVTEWLAKGVEEPAQMTNLSKDLRATLAERMGRRPRVVTVSEADGGLTRKVLLECGEADRLEAVESVLMLYPRTPKRSPRATVCISTQAGCAMGCPFCATGQIGFRRQLGVGETVRQVTVMERLLADPDGSAEAFGAPISLPADVPDHVTNVVFMGMGEPLANLDVTLDAIRWLHGPFNLSARSITVSTVGLVPGIRALIDLDLPVTLAISLHAPDDDLRDDLVPVNRQHPLDELVAAGRDYMESTGRRLTFEYVMIDGVNSDPDQAHQLRRLLNHHMPRGSAHVNLIPMNPTPAVPWHAPPIPDQQAFAKILVDAGISATIRANRGNDIDAACGQLYANYQVASGRILPAAVGAFERIDARR